MSGLGHDLVRSGHGCQSGHDLVTVRSLSGHGYVTHVTIRSRSGQVRSRLCHSGHDLVTVRSLSGHGQVTGHVLVMVSFRYRHGQFVASNKLSQYVTASGLPTAKFMFHGDELSWGNVRKN